MKFKELLEKDSKELCEMCASLKKEGMNLRIRMKTTQDVNTSSIRRCKKDTARVLTRLRQLKIGNGGSSNA
ncbi:MAG: 50S ribosomal protein L29 [Holosporales bacterium]|jgi:ribosomal protein L29|nr:50S ribosomal protein L29 [Holosporales bacterium]